MFKDSRNKKIILIAHCILNQNSISDGTADYPGAINKIIKLLLKHDIGILQMPCPEMICLGLDRGDIEGAERPVVIENTRIRKELNKVDNKYKVDILVQEVVKQIEDYIKNNFKVLGIVGINRSPSCGVETTSINDKEVKGKGIFIKKIYQELKKKKINITFIGVKNKELDKALKQINKLINL